jgi:DNA-directed RNA polymerase subunit K/omega
MSDVEDDYNNSDNESVASSEPDDLDEPDFQSSSIPNIKINKDEIVEEGEGGEGEGGDDDEIVDDGEEDEGVVDETTNEHFNVNIHPTDINYNDDDSDDENEDYLQKFNAEITKNYIVDFHPEMMSHNYEEITAMSKVIKDDQGNIIDELHRTIPLLTKYERARILGQRAKQINAGAKVFVTVPENVLDGYIIAELELLEKKIPFIIRRPIAGGGCEYWCINDLENLCF